MILYNNFNMVQNKLDIRTLKTQSIIQETLKKILLNKDVKDITVYELCKEANINRGTFYNHYNNISEVYEVIFNDMFTSIQEKINKLNLIHFEDDDLIELLDLILNNKYIFENFIKSGAFDGLGGTRKQYMQVYMAVMDSVQQEKKHSLTGQMSLFDLVPEESRKEYELKLPDVGEFEKEEN